MNESQLRHAIEDVASKTGVPEAEVQRCFEQALGSLCAHARVQDYLLVLAGRKVRESLRAMPGAQADAARVAPAARRLQG
ncbi:DUF3562 domain-containing protein [Vogesella sp. LIG4]|uniref:DUF3562 domain-containing protein n=1 Tax=Vogesella sp. LIG4 TaxID=1192162 RepID=UPI0008200EF8|nr:DUF3562 domain-containing protein [Vogesella sp. LIG4]SCK12642.1 Protein of unknown function [Vogesella sp. LIG4]